MNTEIEVITIIRIRVTKINKARAAARPKTTFEVDVVIVGFLTPPVAGVCIT